MKFNTELANTILCTFNDEGEGVFRVWGPDEGFKKNVLTYWLDVDHDFKNRKSSNILKTLFTSVVKTLKYSADSADLSNSNPLLQFDCNEEQCSIKIFLDTKKQQLYYEQMELEEETPDIDVIEGEISDDDDFEDLFPDELDEEEEIITLPAVNSRSKAKQAHGKVSPLIAKTALDDTSKYDRAKEGTLLALGFEIHSTEIMLKHLKLAKSEIEAL